MSTHKQLQELLIDYLSKRIGNRVVYYDQQGERFIGELSSVQINPERASLFLSIVNKPDLSGDYWNGGSYLPGETIEVLGYLVLGSLAGDGTLRLLGAGQWAQAYIKPFPHSEPFDKI